MAQLDLYGIITRVCTKLKDRFAAKTHLHSAADVTTGTLPIARGGTGATTAAAAVVNIVDGQALKPASVAATGEVSGKSGTTTHKLTNKAESSAVAYVEGTTATKNHAVGDYFILGGVLMKTTAAIATGESITTSNATPATVQAQIDALRDSVCKFDDRYLSNVQFSKVDTGTNVGFQVYLFGKNGTDVYLGVTNEKISLRRRDNGGSWTTVRDWT